MELSPNCLAISFHSYQSKQSKPKLSILESLGVKCVISRSAHKLAIISQLLPPISPDVKDNSSNNRTLAETMSKHLRIKPPESKKSDQQEALQYIQKYMQILEFIFCETVRDLESSSTTSNIKQFLWSEIMTRFEEYEARQELIDSGKTITDLRGSIKDHNLISEKTKNFLKTTETCLEATNTTAYVIKETVRRRNRFERVSRVEQNHFKLAITESDLKKNINETESVMKNEKRIHSEIKDQLNVMLSQLQTDINYWTRRYNDDIDNLDVNILQIQNKIEELKSSMENLQNMILEQEEQFAELDQELEKLEENRRLDIAVRVIQKWWICKLMDGMDKNLMKSRSTSRKATGSIKVKKRKATGSTKVKKRKNKSKK